MNKLLCALALVWLSLFSAWGQEGIGARAWTNSASIIVDPNGNDSNDGRSASRTKLTLLNALAAASSGQTVILNPGVYDVGTNVLNVPHGVSMVGAGSGSTFILTSCPFFSGSTYFNNCAIVPGNNSVISDMTIGCTTNGKYAAGIGTIYKTGGKAFTNVTYRNLVFTNFSSDVCYIEHTQRCSWDAYNCKFGTREGPAHFDVIANVQATADSRFRYFGCSSYVDPSGVTVINPTAIGNAINHLEGVCDLYDYTAIVTNVLHGNGLFSQEADHTLAMYGGNINIYPTNGGVIGYYAGTHAVDGNFTINGQHFTSGNGSSTSQTVYNNPADTSVVAYGTSVDQYGDFFVTAFDGTPTASFSSFSLVVNTNGGANDWVLHHTGLAVIDSTLKVASGVITNGFTVWLSTNATPPTLAYPNGSICTTSDGGFWVRTNSTWVRH